MPAPEHCTSTDGTTIAWYDHGGDGPDLLLAHATGFCAAVWAPVVEVLRASFRCVSYDMRGHGRSGRPPIADGQDGWDWARYAADAASVLADAGITEALGVGHSCGGATELLLEEQLPGTFRALYLFEPVVFPVDPPSGPDPDRPLALRTRKRRTTFASRDEALTAFGSRGPFSTLDPRVLGAYVDEGFSPGPDGSIQLRCAPDDEADVYVMASGHRGYVELPSVTCPVWVGHGEQSTSFTEGQTRAVADRLPRGTFVEGPGLGHFGPLEEPEHFAEAVVTAFRSEAVTGPR